MTGQSEPSAGDELMPGVAATDSSEGSLPIPVLKQETGSTRFVVVVDSFFLSFFFFFFWTYFCYLDNCKLNLISFM